MKLSEIKENKMTLTALVLGVTSIGLSTGTFFTLSVTMGLWAFAFALATLFFIGLAVMLEN